jgi:hypothetical protein
MGGKILKLNWGNRFRSQNWWDRFFHRWITSTLLAGWLTW